MATKIKLIADNVITTSQIDTSSLDSHFTGGTGVTYSSGTISIGQAVATTDNVTFADLTVTGDLNITGDINSYNVTDLDVTDQTITLGAGQIEANSGGSGIIVAGSEASILWDENNDEWDFNKPLNVAGNIQTNGIYRAYDSVSTNYRNVLGYDSGNVKLQTGTGSSSYGISLFTAGTERLTINGSGHVGIGVTPSNWHSTNNTALQIRSIGFVQEDVISNLGLGRNAVQNGTWSYIANGYAQMLNLENDGAFKFFQASSGTAGNTISFTQAMTLDASGNLGIGTSSPAEKLHIAASSYTEPTGGLDDNINLLINNTQYCGIQVLGSSTGSSFIHFGDQNDANVGIITYEHNGDYMRFDVNATERMRIDDSGNVGIGTNSPTSSLDVNGIVSLKGNDFLDSDTNSHYIKAPTHLYLYSNASDLNLTVHSNGNVGIGTTTPDAKLEVEGRATGGYTGQQETMRLSSGSATLANGQGPGLVFHGRVATAGGTTELAQIVGGRDETTDGYTSGMLAFYTRQVYANPMVEQMRITSSGRVGIGTTSPTFDFDLRGQNNTHMAYFENSADGGGGNGATFTVYNVYGNHSWGIVQECRVGGGGGSDNPSLLFSSGTESTNTWSVGYGFTDNAFRIKTDHGHRNGSWGTARLTLDRSGNCTITGSLTQNSDERLKENIQTIENAVDTIKQLRGVTFDWIETGEESMGLVAQEVEIVPVVNRLVKESLDDGNMEEFRPKTVNYQNMVALLIEGIKEQQTIIDNLKSRIETLEG